MTKKDKPDTSFMDAVKGIKRMTNHKVVLKQPVKKSRKPHHSEEDEEALIPIVESAEKLFFKSKPLPNKLVRQLKLGKLSPEESIDLHGMTEKQALDYLDEFLEECIAHESFCVCIIHGKGRKQSSNPILKNAINRALRKDNRILAFATAPQQLGGTGAVLALLTH